MLQVLVTLDKGEGGKRSERLQMSMEVPPRSGSSSSHQKADVIAVVMCLSRVQVSRHAGKQACKGCR